VIILFSPSHVISIAVLEFCPQNDFSASCDLQSHCVCCEERRSIAESPQSKGQFGSPAPECSPSELEL